MHVVTHNASSSSSSEAPPTGSSVKPTSGTTKGKRAKQPRNQGAVQAEEVNTSIATTPDAKEANVKKVDGKIVWCDTERDICNTIHVDVRVLFQSHSVFLLTALSL